VNTKPYIVIAPDEEESDVRELMLDSGDELGYNATPYTTYGEDLGIGEMYNEVDIY
jgi:hypothetical protein